MALNLNLYNTKSRSIETFTPQHPPEVSMYACGPTVYDYTHIGHMRKYVGDDILKRVLLALGFEVNHVMNITDVGHLTGDEDETGEDKMEKGAKKSGKTVWEVAKFFTDYFETTMHAVNVIPPNHTTPATEHIPAMISLIEKLVAKGFTYETANALYFDVSKDAQYGQLSGQKLSEKMEGARDDVVIDSEKKNPADFVLWFKRVGKFKDHMMHWESPWGNGFPGWHIECSAMSMQYLGEEIDIHTGGIDHIPVHHENEIAQSECGTGHAPFVHYWVHHNFLNVDGEKMSKSKENYYNLDDIRKKNIDPLALRLMFMQTSYRKPLNFTWESAESAQTALIRLRTAYQQLPTGGGIVDSYKNKFLEALADDLNTPVALAALWELVADKEIALADKKATLLYFDEVLGIDITKENEQEVIPEAVVKRATAREEARKNLAWNEADSLREEIERLGFTVLDTEDGPIVKKK